MAVTIRFPAELHREAAAYADRLGISLNALVAVAVRDYLDRRGGSGAAGGFSPLHPVASEPPQGGEGT